MTAAAAAFARAIPKIELHLHLEGAVRPATFVELTAKNGVALPANADVSDLYRYSDLSEFLKVYDLVCRSVVTADDFHRITYEMLESCADGGARHIEFFWSAHAHMALGVAYRTMLEGILRAMADIEHDRGVTSFLIPAHGKPLGPEAGVEFVDLVLAHRDERVVGIGLDYDEVPNNPALFAAMYDKARAAGLRTTVHAGECGPAAFVRGAVEVLRTDRVDHGYHVVDDQDLVALCRERCVFFTCCPSTTRVTTVFKDLSSPDHAIRRMIAAGLNVTLSTDDPPMFGTDLGHEFELAATVMELTPAELRACVLTWIDASWLDEGTRRTLRADWAREIDALMPGQA